MPVSENELLELLNSAPVVDGKVSETVDDGKMRALRNNLQRVIRGETEPAILDSYLRGVSRVPSIAKAGVVWALRGPASSIPYAEVVLEWDRVLAELPGRLRACGNPECNKFLIDHSKPNTARWCSMAECGNRMKARRHYARQASPAG
jgi:predicted RNA-binding Zn ribbon-like protein